MNGLSQTLRTLGPGRLLVMGIVGAGMMGFFLFLASRLATPGLVLLYSDLEMDDSGQIVGQLESMGVAYKLAGNGAQIMVPSDQVLRLRVALAEQGLLRRFARPGQTESHAPRGPRSDPNRSRAPR